ncbi:putative uncharacterized alpha/beta hydrolase domain (DUF2235) [Lyophyllum shimeji]|uniref:Uncharacterized alpha/beta hydrolase domain (DUF2235) n=1 Tax=Lyophyllum shimeji TaxID=47721 RepID=A0A9P3PQI5_LYOSH|nr:putative uncharacterized alpha/beta hydrolase domain (DUF2235) [Lyophyllum shimeji]
MSSSPIDHVQDQSVASVLSDTATVAASPQGSTFTGAGITTSGFPKTIPTPGPGRALVLCFDGTGDQFDSDNSNIVEFFTMLKKDDRDKQMVYYQAGIGTYTKPQVVTPLAAKLSKSLDEAIAWNLSAHVMDGYEFLMQNYKAGDRICIFGFSRGPYTARGLAGMIHKVGLLPACNHQQVPFAYKMYTRADEVGWKQSNAFKKAFSVDVPIEFIGVWDTVNSVGLIPHRLPFTTSNTIVRTFRHAVSLDERRAKFKANLWNRPTAEEAMLGVDGQKPDVSHLETTHSSPDMRKKPVKHDSLKALEARYSGTGERPTDIEEVWFAGCHCDVGGGSVGNGTPHTLARIPLRWMVRECFKTDTGIIFTTDGLRGIGLDPASLYPYVQKRPPPLPVTGMHIQRIPSAAAPTLENFANVDNLVEPLMTEEEHELHDALSPIYDQLSLNWFWWTLELLPMKQRYQKTEDNSWSSYINANLGRGRFIPKQKRTKIKIHRSVKLRMDAQYADGARYVPKASFETALAHGNVEWID